MSDAHVVNRGLQRLREGQHTVESLADQCYSGRATEEDHRLLRETHRTLRSAMNWLEDSEHFETAHVALDEAGKIARECFPDGCVFPYRDGTYYVECPVALAHNRVGLSPGILIKSAMCSICKNDPEDCAHIAGRTYDGQRCIRVINDAEILEISLVGRPAQPDARIESMSIDIDEFRTSLGPDFTPGVPVTCDRCLSVCDGVARPFEDPSLYDPE